jgi:hypothetical protein
MIVAEEPTTGGAVKPGRITTVVKVAAGAGRGGGGGGGGRGGGGGGESKGSLTRFKNIPTAAPA